MVGIYSGAKFRVKSKNQKQLPAKSEKGQVQVIIQQLWPISFNLLVIDRKTFVDS